jgi:hypothetical protein
MNRLNEARRALLYADSTRLRREFPGWHPTELRMAIRKTLRLARTPGWSRLTLVGSLENQKLTFHSAHGRITVDLAQSSRSPLIDQLIQALRQVMGDRLRIEGGDHGCD